MSKKYDWRLAVRGKHPSPPDDTTPGWVIEVELWLPATWGKTTRTFRLGRVFESTMSGLENALTWSWWAGQEFDVDSEVLFYKLKKSPLWRVVGARDSLSEDKLVAFWGWHSRHNPNPRVPWMEML